MIGAFDFSLRKNVLILDDDESMRRVARRILEGGGYEVHEASNGAEAVRTAENIPALALVISDVVIPGMTAAAAWEAISMCCPDARVLFTSGYTQVDLVAQALLTPRTPLLNKPYKRVALLSAVQHALAPMGLRGPSLEMS